MQDRKGKRGGVRKGKRQKEKKWIKSISKEIKREYTDGQLATRLLKINYNVEVLN